MRPKIGIHTEHRGRTRGLSSKDYANLRSIAYVAKEHELNPKRLIDAFFEATENKISHCGNLEISCRDINQESAMFLLTKEDKVIWQFPVNIEMIQNPRMRNYIEEISIPKKKIDEPRKLKIDELRFGMKDINVTAEVIEIPKSRLVNTRWGNQAIVSNVKLTDDTGTIRIALWNQQIETVHVGDVVELNNCSVYKFLNDLQLKIGRKGLLSVIPKLQTVST